MGKLIHEELTWRIIGAAMEVHSKLGPGLLEMAYQHCLERELSLRGLRVECGVEMPLDYKGIHLEGAYRLDIWVERTVIIELKSVERLTQIHESQLLTYLRISRSPVGLLINFREPHLRDGIQRYVV
jgi:GxxExxY protein